MTDSEGGSIIRAVFIALVMALGSGVDPSNPVPPPPPPEPPARVLAPLTRNPRGIEITAQLSIGGGFRYAMPTVPAPDPIIGVFTMAVRTDILLGRAQPLAWGIGPYLSLRTNSFTDFSPSLGASLLIPVNPDFPLVASLGAVGRFDALGFTPGVLERVWWGARSYNFHGVYVLSAGLFLEARQFTDVNTTVDFVIGADLDLQALAIPFMAIYTWVARRDPGR